MLTLPYLTKGKKGVGGFPRKFNNRGTPFDPFNVTNLEIAWDTELGVTQASNRISELQDQSGNVRHWEQLTAARQLEYWTGNGTPNNHPIIAGRDGSQVAAGSTATFVAQGAAVSFTRPWYFCVVNQPLKYDAGNYVVLFTSVGTSLFFYFFAGPDRIIFETTGNVIIPTPPRGEFVIIDGLSKAGAGASWLRINGGAKIFGTMTADPGGAATLSMMARNTHGNPNNAANTFGVIINDEPATAYQDDLQTYLRTRYFGAGNTEESTNNKFVEYWPMDEATGAARVGDIQSYSLTNFNSATQIAGKVGNATQFNGTTQYLEMADQTDMRAGAFPFFLWARVRFTALGAANQVILHKADSSIPDDEWILYYFFPTGSLRLEVYDSTPVSIGNVNVGGIVAGTWYDVVCGWDQWRRQLYMSVNGAARVLSNASISMNPSGGAARIRVGQYAWTSGILMNGDVNDWGFGHGVASDKDIADYFNGGTGNKYPFAT